MGKTNAAGGKGPGFLTYLLSVFLFIAGWQLLAWAVSAPLILPGPLVVLARLLQLCRRVDFYRHVTATMGRAFLAFFISGVLGTLLGLAFGSRPALKAAASPFLTAVRSTPVVSFILLAVLCFGSSAVPVFVAVLMALPVMTTAVATGFSTVPRGLLDAAASYSLSRRQVFRQLRLPFLLPFLKDGMLSSFGMSWKVVVAGEVLSLPRLGAGRLLYTAQVHLESADLIAVTLAVVLLSYALERGGVLLLSRMRKTALNPAGRPGAREDGPVRKPLPGAGGPPAFLLSGFSAHRSGKSLYRDFSLELTPADSTAIVAPSGAGKTTLLDFAAGLLGDGDGSFSGRLSFAGPDGKPCDRPRISYLFQEPRLFPACTVRANVMLPLVNLLGRDEAEERALRFIKECGLEGRASAFPSELSGGERRRAALARAFAFPSSLMLLDEAFQGQDLAQKVALMGLYEKLLADSPRTVLFVTHDIREALACCSRVVVLKGSPLRVELDERLFPGKSSFSGLYLDPDGERRNLELRTAGILLGGRDCPSYLP